jgi:Xaa-Pro dipeptidase
MLDLPRIQQALKREAVDAWLLYDFRGQNTIAREVLGTPEHAILTRRWFYCIPAQGEPVALQQVMEPESVAHLPGRKIIYRDRGALQDGLKSMLGSFARVAMEYSPQAALPTLSRVDSGTVEMVEGLGPKVVSSANLVQDFLAVLGDEQIHGHRRAADVVLKVKDAAFDMAALALKRGRTLGEFDLREFILEQFAKSGIETDHGPIVATNDHAGRPHYEPTREVNTPIKTGDLLLIDLWGREPGGVFADITWTGFLGEKVPAKIAEVFSYVAGARDAAVAAILDGHREGRVVTGAQADRAARAVIEKAGYGDYFIHRTGHSITATLHGPGANLDDFETEDSRPLVPGLLFSVEPGIYLEDFGIRSEINVLMTKNGPEVTTLPLQTEVLPLLRT